MGCLLPGLLYFLEGWGAYGLVLKLHFINPQHAYLRGLLLGSTPQPAASTSLLAEETGGRAGGEA